MSKIKHSTELVLVAGAIMLASIKQSETDSKAILEFAEGFAPQNLNILALANEGDNRFSPAVSIRRAWLTTEKANLAKFGITAEQIAAMKAAYVENGGHAVVMIADPTIAVSPTKKVRLAIQLKDSLKPFDQFQEENKLKTCKQVVDRKTGKVRYFVKDNQLIFSRADVVALDERKNQIIASDARITEEEAKALVETTVAANEALNKIGA